MIRRHDPTSPGCRDLFARLSEYLDGEMDPAACEEAEAHLGDCPPCHRFLESLRRTVTLLNREPDERVPEEIRREVREAIDRLRRERRG